MSNRRLTATEEAELAATRADVAEARSQREAMEAVVAEFGYGELLHVMADMAFRDEMNATSEDAVDRAAEIRSAIDVARDHVRRYERR